MTSPIQVSLEDFIPDFIDQQNPETINKIQSVVSSRKEFTSVKAKPVDVFKENKLLPPQEFIGRYMVSADRCVLIWQPGVGKLCGVVSPAEKFRFYTKIAKENTNIKRCVILLKGGGAVKQFKSKIKCECSDSLLPDMLEDSQAFNKFYTIMTWKTFINHNILEREVKGSKSVIQSQKETKQQLSLYSDNDLTSSELSDTEEDLEDSELHELQTTYEKKKLAMDIPRIAKEYSGTLFIIDEFHNLRSGAGVEGSDYTILQTIFDNTPNIKVVGSSATPMFDKADEIIPSLNLILPREKRIPSNIDLTDITYEEFSKYIRGYISYVKSPESAAVPNYVENPRAPDVLKQISTTFKSYTDDGAEFKGSVQSPVYWIPISNSQRELYKQVVDNYSQDIDIPDAQEKNSLYHNHRSVLHGIFPGPEISFEGFIQKDPKNPDNIKGTPELMEAIRSDLQELSPKYNECMNIINKSSGKVFAYFIQIQGAYLDYFSLILEENGYDRYTGKSEQKQQQRKYNKNTLEGIKQKYCAITSDTINISTISKKPRYAIITGTSGNEARDRDIINLFNSPENVDGEYIKILIASPVFRETYSLTDVLTVINMSVYWNISSSYQAEYRVIRTGSHRNYSKKKNIPNPRVDIYRIAMYDPENLPSITEGQLKLSKYTPVDVALYKMASEKDIQIHRILRFMKRSAIDGVINYERNVLSLKPEYRGRKECDYQECVYKVDTDLDITYINTDNFDVLYSHDTIHDIITIVKQIFLYRHSIHKTELEDIVYKKLLETNSLPDITKKEFTKYVYMAMYECIYKNILTDFLGFPVLCDRNGDVYYIYRNGLNGYQDIQYHNNMYMVESNEINKYVSEKVKSQEYKDSVMKSLIEEVKLDKSDKKLDKMSPATTEYLYKPYDIPEDVYKRIETKVNTMTKQQKIVLLETALMYDATVMLKKTGDKTIQVKQVSMDEFNTYQVVKKMFKGYYFCINNPVEAIEMKTDKAKVRGKEQGKRGRKPNNPYNYDIKKIDEATLDDYLEEIPPGEHRDGAVFIHFMHVYHDPLRTKYSVVSNYYNPKDSRYLDLSYNDYDDKQLQWRDATEIQRYIFGNIIQLLNLSKIDAIRENVDEVYGIILSDKELRIVNLTKERSSKKKGEEKKGIKGRDSRTSVRGSECKHYKVLNLLDLFGLMYSKHYIELPEIKDVLGKISSKKRKRDFGFKDMFKAIDKFSIELEDEINSMDKKDPTRSNNIKVFKVLDEFLAKLDEVKDYEKLPDKDKYKIISYYSFVEFYNILKDGDVDLYEMITDGWEELILYIYYENTGAKMCDVLFGILEKNNLIFYDDIDIHKSRKEYLYDFRKLV